MSETLALFLVAQAPDPLICAETDGDIQAWNQAAEAMFGMLSENAIGQDLENDITPEQSQAAHWIRVRPSNSSRGNEVPRKGTPHPRAAPLALISPSKRPSPSFLTRQAAWSLRSPAAATSPGDSSETESGAAAFGGLDVESGGLRGAAAKL